MTKPTIIIIAGGLATRMKPITEDIPKCLVDVAGKPLIERQIEYLAKRGYKDYVFCVAHLADKVRQHFGNGSRLGVRIRYSQETKELLGTAGAAKFVEYMVGERCIIYYGDNLTTINFDKALEFHEKNSSDFTIILRNLPEGYKSSSIITLDETKMVDTFLEKPTQEEFDERSGEKIYINDGIYIMNKSIFSLIPEDTKFDFAKDLIPMIMSNDLNFFGCVSDEFFVELGRVEKYEKFKEEIAKRGMVLEQGDVKLKRAIFLDRDGVINATLGSAPKKIEEFIIPETVPNAIKKINDKGYFSVIATNQPDVAKGILTFDTLDIMHEKMKNVLAKEGAHIDAIYVCPHHPEKGFPSEIPELKIVCDCRKPKPGLLVRAMKEHFIDPKQSWMIGDSLTDIAAGQAAGVKTILLTSSPGSKSKDEAILKEKGIQPDFSAYDLKEAVEIIFRN